MKNLFLLGMLLVPIMASGYVDYYGNTDEHIMPDMEIVNCPQDTPPGWREDERLSLNDAKESISPRGVSDALGRIHVVWKDNRRLHGFDEIHYRVRIDTLWDSLYAISNLDTVHNSPWIAVDKKNNVHVVFLRWFGAAFANYDVGYRKYNDSLSVWEPEERITQSDSIGLTGRPMVLCDTNDVVYAFWLNVNQLPPTIWYSTNNGTGWSPKMEVTDVNDTPDGYFGIAVAPDNRIHCVWQDYRSGTPELYHRYLQDGFWSQSVAVTVNGFASVYPRLSADTLSNIHFVYGGGLSLSEKIHYLVWDSSTQIWGPETTFSSQMALPHVDIAVSPLDSDVHLTFHESIAGHIEIMYKHYDAQTEQWKPSVQLTFNYPDLRLDPQICLDPDDYVHLFWWDERDGTGQEEIYYKTNRIQLEVEEVKPELTNGMELLAYPNPFKQMTEISFSVERKAYSVERSALSIYDITGRLIKNLSLPTAYSPGLAPRSGTGLVPTVVSWDGLDELGNDCPPGVYILNVEAEGISKSLMLIHIE